MDKKQYTKPVVASRRVELGVFGDYSGTPGGGNSKPQPVSIIERLNLRME